MRFPLTILAAAGLLAACAVSSEGTNQLLLNRDGAAFTGTAGASWTDAELQQDADDLICPGGAAIADLKMMRDPTGQATFSGRCG
jgi:hypothetical protein